MNDNFDNLDINENEIMDGGKQNKTESKKSSSEIKDNIVAGASAAAGGVAGVFVGTAATPAVSNAMDRFNKPGDTEEKTEEKVEEKTEEKVEVKTEEKTWEKAGETDKTAKIEVKDTDHSSDHPHEPVFAANPSHHADVSGMPNPEPEPETQVLSYERLTNEYGEEYDLAVLEHDGKIIGVIDEDLDGEADYLMSDLNDNGVIEDDEIAYVTGENIRMEPLAQAVGFDEPIDLANANVLEYERVAEDGELTDVAIVEYDGHLGVVIDEGADGMADIIAIDRNDNLVFEENEISQVTYQDISMEPLSNQVIDDSLAWYPPFHGCAEKDIYSDDSHLAADDTFMA